MSSKTSPKPSSTSASIISGSSSLVAITSSEFADLTESTSAAPTIFTSSGTTTNNGTTTLAASVTANHLPPSPTSAPPTNLFPATSSAVSRASSAQSNQNGLSQGVIGIIISLSLIFVLSVVAGTIFFLRRRRRIRAESQSDDGGSRNIDSDEKYDTAERSQYAPSISQSHRKSLMDQGRAPLLDVPSIGQHSRSTSLSSDLESHMYHDGPTSPFLNESEKRAERNAVSYPGPYAQSGDAAFEAVNLLPAASQTSRASNKLPPFQIAETYKAAPPSRRPSKGKNWKRGSSANVTPDTAYDSDDSASLYSQASASTHRTYATRHSNIPPFAYPSVPLPSIPQSPANKISKIEGSGVEGTTTLSDYTGSAIDSFGQEEEGNGGLGKEETLLVATLIQSRLSRAPNPASPTRSSSIVSHIERAGSIKPVLTSLETGTASRYPRGSRARRARDVIKSQVLNSELRRADPDL